MAESMERPRPLEAEEIKLGIAQLVADAVYERLGKTCNLYGRSYPKFKGVVTIRLELDDFGQVVIDNSTATVEGGEEAGTGTVAVDTEVTIDEMPPNQFRMETDQPVTKTVIEDGKSVEKKVTYKPRTKTGAKKEQAKAAAKKAAKKAVGNAGE